MKRHFFFAVLALMTVIFSCTSLYAEQNHLGNFYVGAGGSYAVEDFDNGPDYDNSWGVNAKIGYHTHPLLDIELDFDYLNNFEYDESYKVSGTRFKEEGDLEIFTCMFALKGYFPISTEKVKLSTIVGAGLMHADSKHEFFSSALPDKTSISGSNDEIDLCGKVGLGLDFFTAQDISIGIEGNYTFGFGDLDDIRYFNFIIGAAYHF
ncbi:MAG: porin family protein [Deltaproteobacteria bacterium]|nr:porin family protein [Deltaproteobacteria bacterium]